MPEERTIGSREGGRALAIVPAAVAVLVGALMLPRAAQPDAIPVPLADTRALAEVAARDRTLAELAVREPLPGEVRLLGSAIRDFNTREAKDADAASLSDARAAIDKALGLALGAGMDKLVELRAAQTEAFLAEARRFEATGTESDELQALGGSFVRRMRLAGWCDAKNRIVLDADQRRAAFKATWNALVNLDKAKELQPSIDETRALYTLYIVHPHAPEAVRDEVAAARKNARDARACAAIDAREEAAIEQFRLDKIKRLGALDPTYPLAYAVGVTQFRRGQFPAAAESFRTWLREHPSGAFSLPARNYLKASIEAAAF